jgi:hypothetical protein
MRTNPFRRAVALAVLLAALASCAGARPPEPPPELKAARGAIASAEQQGAGVELGAQIYLALAQNHLARAERCLAAGDREGALGLLRRARADAEVAALVAQEAALRDAARRTLDEASLLADEEVNP